MCAELHRTQRFWSHPLNRQFPGMLRLIQLLVRVSTQPEVGNFRVHVCSKQDVASCQVAVDIVLRGKVILNKKLQTCWVQRLPFHKRSKRIQKAIDPQVGYQLRLVRRSHLRRFPKSLAQRIIEYFCTVNSPLASLLRTPPRTHETDPSNVNNVNCSTISVFCAAAPECATGRAGIPMPQVKQWF